MKSNYLETTVVKQMTDKAKMSSLAKVDPEICKRKGPDEPGLFLTPRRE